MSNWKPGMPVLTDEDSKAWEEYQREKFWAYYRLYQMAAWVGWGFAIFCLIQWKFF